MDFESDKAIAAVLRVVEFGSLSNLLVFLIVSAAIRIIYVFTAAAVMKIFGLGLFKSLGLTLEALPANQNKKPPRQRKKP